MQPCRRLGSHSARKQSHFENESIHDRIGTDRPVEVTRSPNGPTIVYQEIHLLDVLFHSLEGFVKLNNLSAKTRDAKNRNCLICSVFGFSLCVQQYLT